MSKAKESEFGETPGLLVERRITRSIALPVQECVSMPWPSFQRLLHASWAQSTMLANWASHELARHDVVRLPGMEQLPPMPPIDLYALAFGRAKENRGREFWKCSECARKWHPSQTDEGRAPEHQRGKSQCVGSGKPTTPLLRKVLPPVPVGYEGAGFWEGAKLAAAGLLNRVARKYARERGNIVWRRERRTPEYLYPFPFPVAAKSWEAVFDERGRPLVLMGLPGGRVSVRLRSGDEFRRQLRVLHQIVDGQFGQQELSICRQRSHSVYAKGAGERPVGSHRVGYRTMLRIACRIPVGPASDSDLVAEVRTGGDPFITVLVGDRQPWVLHSDQVRGFIISHRAFLDRMADDLKWEKRWPRKKRKRMLHRIARGCDKHHNRIKSFRQEVAAQVCGFASRQGCGAVRFDSTDRSFVSLDFPWFELEGSLQDKCDELGLAFDSVSAASGDAVEDDDMPENGANDNGGSSSE